MSNFAAIFGNVYNVSYDMAMNDMALLTSSSFVLAYQEYSTYKIKIVIGTVSGSTITYGTALTVVTETDYATISCERLSDTSFAMCYTTTSAAYGKLGLCTVSGTTITISRSFFNLETVQVYGLKLCAITSTTFLLFYRTSSTRVSKVVTTNSAYTTALLGTSTSYQTSSVNVYEAKLINSTTFIIAYLSTSNYPTCRIGTISGTTISYGTAVAAISGACYDDVSICMLSETKFIIGTNYAGTTPLCKVGTISGTTITYGSLLYLDNGGGTAEIVLVNSLPFAVTGSTLHSLDVSGTTVTTTNNTVLPTAFAGTFMKGFVIGLNILISSKGASLSDITYQGIASLSFGKKINGVAYVKLNNTAILKWNNQ